MYNLGIKNGSQKENETLDITYKNGIPSVEKSSEMTVTYIVISDNLTDSLHDVMNAPNLPELETSTLYGNQLYICVDCKGTDAGRTDFNGRPATVWELEYTYKLLKGELATSEEEVLEQLKPTFSWNTEEIMEVLEKDAEDESEIVTKAGEPKFVEHPISVAVLNVTRYYTLSSFSPVGIFVYKNTVNKSKFWGADAGCALMKDIAAEPFVVKTKETEYKFMKVTFRVHFRFDKEDPWKIHYLNSGFKYRKVAGGPVFTNVEKGAFVEVKLDENGVKQAAGDEPVYISKNIYPKRNWNALGIDGTNII